MPQLTPIRSAPPRASAVDALPPRRAVWPRDVVLLAALGAAAAALLWISNQRPLAALVMAAAVGCAITWARIGRLAHLRGQLLDGATEAVLPMLGARAPSRELVTARKWVGRGVGVPSKVRIRYSATIDDRDPRFLAGVIDQLHRRLGTEYQLSNQSFGRRVLELEARDPSTRNADADRAEAVAKELLGAGARVSCKLDDAGTVTEIGVNYSTQTRLSAAGYRQRIEKALSSMLPGRWRARWDTERDHVRFELRPEMPTFVPHIASTPRPELTHASYSACKVTFGVDEDGNELFWQPAISPHMLIVGGTGSGKTSAEHTLLTELSLLGWEVWVLDGKRIEFAGFRDWPNVTLVAASVEHQVRMIHAAHERMEEIYSQILAGNCRIADLQPLALIIDEYATFKARVLRWYKTVKGKGDPTQPPVFDLIADIARLGRTAKLHMATGIQRPDVTFLDGEMRDNYGSRLSLGRLSPQGANMMWDSFAVGVAIPRNQRGRGVALNAESMPVEVQTAYTPDPAKLADSDPDWKILEQLRPAQISHARKSIATPRIDLESNPSGELSYSDWASAPIVAFDPNAPSEPIVTSAGSSDVDLDELSAAVEPSVVVQDAFTGYGEPAGVPAPELGVGDLVLIDEGLELWGVVESSEPDLFEDGAFTVDYRDFDAGEPGMISVPDDATLTVRRPSRG